MITKADKRSDTQRLHIESEPPCKMYLLDGYLHSKSWPELADVWQRLLAQGQFINAWEEPSATPRFLGYEHWLCAQLGWHPQSLAGLACWASNTDTSLEFALKSPIANIDSGRKTSIAPERSTYRSVLLTPCHFYVRLDHVGVASLNETGLSREHAADLRAALEEDLPIWREWFQAWIDIRPIDPMQWLLMIDSDVVQLEGTSLDLAAGLNVEHYLAQGSQSKIWRRVLNQIQMIWYEHPVNLIRQQTGLPPVNALWLGGSLNPGSQNPKRCFTINSQIPIYQGLERYIDSSRHLDCAQLHVMALRPEERSVETVSRGLNQLIKEIELNRDSNRLEFVLCAEHAWSHYRVRLPQRHALSSFWQRFRQSLGKASLKNASGG